MPKLILCRHGQSEWNAKNLFTGWEDVQLSEQGRNEAITSGKKLKENKIEIDVAYSWRLNERHYGKLQGLNKDDARKEFGEEQVHQWRRSYDVLPPAQTEEQRQSYLNDRRYRHLDHRMMPYSESLKTTLERVIPIWTDHISQHLLDGDTVLVAAHGNSIRALIKYLENVSDEDIIGYEIKTGAPLIYELDDDLKVTNHYYL